MRHVPASELLPATPRFANASYGVWHYGSRSDPDGLTVDALLDGPCRPLSQPYFTQRPAWYDIPYDEGYNIPTMSTWSGTGHVMVVCIENDTV